jgi:Xaa-Pro aminopeptidase
VRVVEAINPTTFAKSRKLPSGGRPRARHAMEQDGAALCEFFAWLEPLLADPQRAPLTEVAIDEQITARVRAVPASSARASAPSPASTPTARSCTTAPRRNRTPSSKATACC